MFLYTLRYFVLDVFKPSFWIEEHEEMSALCQNNNFTHLVKTHAPRSLKKSNINNSLNVFISKANSMLVDNGLAVSGGRRLAANGSL